MIYITYCLIQITCTLLLGTTLPLLYHFGITNTNIKIHKRGAAPSGGGLVELHVDIVRELKPVLFTDVGLVSRVRGCAYCTRISPTVLTRVIDSSRSVLNEFLPDVHIYTDHYKGTHGGGNSPGYSIYLTAETTTGVKLSIERTCGTSGGEIAENIGEEAAYMLLEEVNRGGCIDSTHQSLVLLLMILTPEDICKLRFGK